MVHAERLAANKLLPVEDEGEAVSGTCQFMATLLVYGGQSGVQDILGAPFYPQLDRQLKAWRQKYRGQFAEETTQRCLDLLDPTSMYSQMRTLVQDMHEKGLSSCAMPNCSIKVNLMQCAR